MAVCSLWQLAEGQIDGKKKEGGEAKEHRDAFMVKEKQSNGADPQGYVIEDEGDEDSFFSRFHRLLLYHLEIQ